MQEKEIKRAKVSKSFGQRRQESAAFSANRTPSFWQQLLGQPKKELAIVISGVALLIGAFIFWNPHEADVQLLQRYPKAWETTQKVSGVTYYSDTSLTQGP